MEGKPDASLPTGVVKQRNAGRKYKNENLCSTKCISSTFNSILSIIIWPLSFLYTSFVRIYPITVPNKAGGLLLGNGQVTHTVIVVKKEVFSNKDFSLGLILRVSKGRYMTWSLSSVSPFNLSNSI